MENKSKYHIKTHIANEPFSISLDATDFKKLNNLKTQLVTNVVIELDKSFFSKGRAVKNIIRFELIFKGANSKFTRPNNKPIASAGGNEDFDIALNNSLPNIFFVLESPHRKEFDELLKPKGPAMGNTGESILKYFPSNVLPKMIENNLDLVEGEKYNFKQ